jgi:hypothetical protein
MLRKLHAHVRANAVGYVALFVALSGTAVAASTLPAGSVGTRQLQDRAVTGSKVARNTLVGANIKVSTLGTVPNAARLGHLQPSAFQSRVRGDCSGSGAISQISAAGAVSCQPSAIGTLTGLSAGSGLTGGGTTGNVTLSADQTVLQHRLSSGCPAGQAIQGVAASGAPSCQAFGSGNGTITGVSPGSGLTGGGTTGTLTLNVDPTAVQQRVSGSCTTGSAIAAVEQAGTVSCTAGPVYSEAHNGPPETVASGATFPFPTLDASTGVTASPDGTTFTVSTSGRYEATVTLIPHAAFNQGSIFLNINNGGGLVSLPQAAADSPATTTRIIPLVAGDQVTVQNRSVSVVTLNQGSTLQLIRLGP